MVEGDGCHRVAAQHRRSLVGRKFKASSPNGRFRAGARAIVRAGGVLIRIEVHGKNMFYFFGRARRSPEVVVVHVHFGMAGAFAVYKRSEPDVTPNTRLRLESSGSNGLPWLVAHLSAMLVEHGTVASIYTPAVQRLGPDPLRNDAVPEQFLARCASQKKAIGAVLMDQGLLAGVGNIYRSESLYEAGIHPEQPANSLGPTQLLGLWGIIVRQMRAGFRSGSIWGDKAGPSCYGRKRSAFGGKVKEWSMGGRNVYACGKRQKLQRSRPCIVMAIDSEQSGTRRLGKMVPAAMAEDRKRKSGEGLAVQHVALKDDATLAGSLKAAAKKRGSSASTNYADSVAVFPLAKRQRAMRA